jgi:hypothetical protein
MHTHDQIETTIIFVCLKVNGRNAKHLSVVYYRMHHIVLAVAADRLNRERRKHPRPSYWLQPRTTSSRSRSFALNLIWLLHRPRHQ